MLTWELVASVELTTRQVYEYKTFRLKIRQRLFPPPPSISQIVEGGNLSGSAESFRICHLLEPEADVQVWLLSREAVLIGFRHSQPSARSGLYAGPRSRVPFLRMMFP